MTRPSKRPTTPQAGTKPDRSPAVQAAAQIVRAHRDWLEFSSLLGEHVTVRMNAESVFEREHPPPARGLMNYFDSVLPEHRPAERDARRRAAGGRAVQAHLQRCQETVPYRWLAARPGFAAIEAEFDKGHDQAAENNFRFLVVVQRHLVNWAVLRNAQASGKALRLHLTKHEMSDAADKANALVATIADVVDSGSNAADRILSTGPWGPGEPVSGRLVEVLRTAAREWRRAAAAKARAPRNDDTAIDRRLVAELTAALSVEFGRDCTERAIALATAIRVNLHRTKMREAALKLSGKRSR